MDDISLRVAARFIKALNAGDTFENEHYRIHRYMSSIKVIALANAGKRGKKVEGFHLGYASTRTFPAESVALEFIMLANRGVDFGRMLQSGKEAAELGATIDILSYRGVDVMPGGFKSVEIVGDHIYVKAEYDSFVVRDNDDQNNLPTCIPAIKGGKKSIPVFYRWVKDNQSRIKGMLYRDLLKEMQAIGVDYHSYCAMD